MPLKSDDVEQFCNEEFETVLIDFKEEPIFIWRILDAYQLSFLANKVYFRNGLDNFTYFMTTAKVDTMHHN